jgi:hypothetical protein
MMTNSGGGYNDPAEGVTGDEVVFEINESVIATGK